MSDEVPTPSDGRVDPTRQNRDAATAANPEPDPHSTPGADTTGTGDVSPFLQKEWVREFITMALYIGLSLLAVLVALPPGERLSGTNLGLTMVLTSVALLFAHQIAFRLSSRLVNAGLLDSEGQLMLVAQVAGGLAVAAIASVPIFLFGVDVGVLISELLLVGFVGLVAYAAARSASSSRLRSLAYVVFIVVGVLALLGVKMLVKH